ncbi:MAG TPA: hypothetical protein VMY18_10055, partial [Acidobacteriota bacterium]|nr:hypothetical protein [Acidobacteriota bacterium]
MTRRHFLISLICLVLFSPLAGEKIFCQSAWDELVLQNPGVLDDASIDWQERLILHSLTPAQARRYYRGASADDLLVQDGLTLAEYLRAKSNPLGNVYVPLPGSCELFSAEGLLSDEIAAAQVRGICGIPEEATAVILQVKASSTGMSPRLKLWATDLPEPAEAVVEGENSSFDELKAVTAVVSLCAGNRCRGEDLRIKGRNTASVRAEAVGYFRPISASDGAGSGGGLLFSTEGSNNNFFGTGAGASNGTCDPGTSDNSCYNAFFGGDAGTSNTTGHANSFF